MFLPKAELISKGDFFECRIIHEGKQFYFLERTDIENGEIVPYDILIDKENNTRNGLEVGVELKVKVNNIHIADDGTLGLFCTAV